MTLIRTASGINLHIEQEEIVYAGAIEPLIDKLNTHRGAVYSSSFEYPGRYTCWDIGFYNPPLAISVCQTEVVLNALNQRGEVLLKILHPYIKKSPHLQIASQQANQISLRVNRTDQIFSEEERSHQPSVFSLIRVLLAAMKQEDDPYAGLYGAFGYDLIYHFEALEQKQKRTDDQRDLLLYWPDEILIVDHRKETAFIQRYDYSQGALTTIGLSRVGQSRYSLQEDLIDEGAVHKLGEYAQQVEAAKEKFTRGDLFEVVLSQTFVREFSEKPAYLFRQMRSLNPSPYGFFINLGEDEYLVGASPEMYVRVEGQRVETCPISGTIRRGSNAIEDAENIKLLLSSAKDESELTMCTDVDRNDKSRICEAGSVKVIGRRQIEMYSRLIHTVDHVEGRLRSGFDAVDAFLTHMWVVTVTGAPKIWAMRFIESQEKSPRRWYGGAVGWFSFNGDMNTGLVLRTVRLKHSLAELRVGATLLFDSDPVAEEEETRLKASAFLAMLSQKNAAQVKSELVDNPGMGKRVLLIDHQDSFVHTLGNYFRQTGAEVQTVRFDSALHWLDKGPWDLVVLSPGPGCPTDFNLSANIEAIISRKIPIFGVCLGLQALVEYFGGKLAVLDYPMHGKPSTMQVLDRHGIFSGLGDEFIAGRYHSLYASIPSMPACLKITAVSEDGIVMGIKHSHLAIEAVQFHPETILSLPNGAGLHIILNVMKGL